MSKLNTNNCRRESNLSYFALKSKRKNKKSEDKREDKKSDGKTLKTQALETIMAPFRDPYIKIFKNLDLTTDLLYDKMNERNQFDKFCQILFI